MVPKFPPKTSTPPLARWEGKFVKATPSWGKWKEAAEDSDGFNEALKNYKMAENIDEAVKIAREGYAVAREKGEDWFPAVNTCPYGCSVPGDRNWKAAAWYKGFWFWHHVVHQWEKVANVSSS